MIASMYSIPLRWRYVTRGVYFYVAARTSLQGHSRWSQMVPIILVYRVGMLTSGDIKKFLMMYWISKFKLFDSTLFITKYIAICVNSIKQKTIII